MTSPGTSQLDSPEIKLQEAHPPAPSSDSGRPEEDVKDDKSGVECKDPVEECGEASGVGGRPAERSPSSESWLSQCGVCLEERVLGTSAGECGHVFCFLCLKGAGSRSGRCPLCRGRLSAAALRSPRLETAPGAGEGREARETRPVWLYEGGGGWWEYERRCGEALEEAWREGRRSLDLLIAGHVYTVDLAAGRQGRRDGPVTRRRRLRRLSPSQRPHGLLIKGIAGVPADRLPQTRPTTDT